MQNIVPIGRFSKMTRLSVKALRHYDELGLLVPTIVDRSSRYRYYTYGQANRAEAIRVLRSLDMPLEDVREVLDADDPQVAAKVLDRHRARLESELDRHERMLAFLGRLIDRREGIMPYEVEVKEEPEMLVVSVTRHASQATIGKEIGETFGALTEAVGPVGYGQGMPGIVYFDVIDEWTDGTIEVFMPVAARFEPPEGMAVKAFPPMTVASSVHRGPYAELGPAYQAVAAWIQEHGHEIAGPPRELYLNDPGESGQAEALTEVQFPIR
jgi:effector-binding domain-containing protein